jgi:hypothetical protein
MTLPSLPSLLIRTFDSHLGLFRRTAPLLSPAVCPSSAKELMPKRHQETVALMGGFAHQATIFNAVSRSLSALCPLVGFRKDFFSWKPLTTAFSAI